MNTVCGLSNQDVESVYLLWYLLRCLTIKNLSATSAFSLIAWAVIVPLIKVQHRLTASRAGSRFTFGGKVTKLE